MSEIMRYYKPTALAIFSIIISICGAFVFPLFGLILPKVLFVLFMPENPNYDVDDYNYEANFWCGMFLLLSVGYGLTSGLQKICF
mmetsp:Transcript_44018/g.42607  ORF Transcript_44018/g.42607 Transcript_44018/m.42607 type:complete len:85 (+) Transcript_44018:430-684(+)